MLQLLYTVATTCLTNIVFRTAYSILDKKVLRKDRVPAGWGGFATQRQVLAAPGGVYSVWCKLIGQM